MLLHVDRHSGVPVYRQLEDQIRLAVATGRLAPGEELPSTRVLARELGLNPMTVSKVYARLERDGVLERRPGLPVVVRERAADEETAQRLAELERRLEPLAHLARRLGIPPGEAAAIYRRLIEAEQGAPTEGGGSR